MKGTFDAKRCVVMGGAGFIGSHLCERLVAEGAARVVSVDNLVTGNSANLSGFLGRAGFEDARADVSEPFAVEGPLDYVFNLASPASPVDYHQLPLETLRVGARGTEHGLRLAEAAGAVFLQASTSEVYGDPLVHPQREDYWGNVNPIGPRAVYDEAKRYGEALVVGLPAQPGAVDVRIARIFNTYGPRMRLNDGRVVPAFVAQALRRRGLHRLRRREPDPFLLLRARPGGRPGAAGVVQRAGPGEPRQPGRDDDPAVRRSGACGRRGRREDASSARCPRTTRSNAVRTSGGRGRCWAGSRGWRLADGLAETIAWFRKQDGSGRPGTGARRLAAT